MKDQYGARYWGKYQRGKKPGSDRWRPKKPDGIICQICGRPGKVSVDHVHGMCGHKSAKKVCPKCFRGWLCHGCNLLLGWAKDHPVILRKAAEYLERKEE